MTMYVTNGQGWYLKANGTVWTGDYTRAATFETTDAAHAAIDKALAIKKGSPGFIPRANRPYLVIATD